MTENKCQSKILNRMWRGGQCDAFEWADGFCYRHHPAQRLEILKRKLEEHQKEISQLLIAVEKIEKHYEKQG